MASWEIMSRYIILPYSSCNFKSGNITLYDIPNGALFLLSRLHTSRNFNLQTLGRSLINNNLLQKSSLVTRYTQIWQTFSLARELTQITLTRLIKINTFQLSLSALMYANIRFNIAALFEVSWFPPSNIDPPHFIPHFSLP